MNPLEIKSVLTAGAPQPGGHYSQAIVHQGLVYVAGQLPIDPATGEKKLGPIDEQTEQVLANIRAILQAAGSRPRAEDDGLHFRHQPVGQGE